MKHTKQRVFRIRQKIRNGESSSSCEVVLPSSRGDFSRLPRKEGSKSCLVDVRREAREVQEDETYSKDMEDRYKKLMKPVGPFLRSSAAVRRASFAAEQLLAIQDVLAVD